MRSSELCEHLTDLHALRSALAVKHKIFVDERLLTAATFCAAARDITTDAIEATLKEIKIRRAQEGETQQFLALGKNAQ